MRPAIIISNNGFNNTYQDIILVPLTSIIRNEDIEVIINSDNLISGNLVRTSVARIDKLASINKSRIKFHIGKIRESILDSIHSRISTILEKTI
ncbi:MAG: type II toxin-antitoxin system PemK/MazF family toxin [Nanoarchaeota archaeon]